MTLIRVPAPSLKFPRKRAVVRVSGQSFPVHVPVRSRIFTSKVFDMARLTVARIKALKATGKARMVTDERTLYLRIEANGGKRWVQRLMIDGKRRDLGLGGWPLVSIEEARDAAIDNRRMVRRGGDPLAERRKASMPTFREAATATYETNSPRWRNAKVREQWLQIVELHCGPLMPLRIDTITGVEVLAVLKPLWTAKPATGRKVWQRIRAVFRWAQAHGHVASNPAAEGISGALPAMLKQKAHYRALPYADVPAALATVEAMPRASMASKAALRFAVLTAARSGEVLGATWSEIDLDAREWRIAGERMKGGLPHRVPLSDAAMAVLDGMVALREGDLVFPSPSRRGKPLSAMSMTGLLRNAGLADRCTMHGFRSSFADWINETTDTPTAIRELSLAHSVGNAVEAAYSRSDLLAKRRTLMARWAAFCVQERGTVVKIA